ncbi:hypothetical protein AYL99_11721 [Fonsecaea erecta]|uniref:Uncharacterized protein n=1 Tax=Fonsecaea erecta TaxID=1367422 RepID=A0A178Z3X1_9EURO|nr:hypothetical protein AYL99_11721 [Fonsecaea erecta]OAP54186.1 hypothetical protein AYL99_11721 [Fonsecaea erecta]
MAERQPPVADHDPPEEKELLTRDCAEAALPEYDYINGWIDLSGDTFKLTIEYRRPNPARANIIGPLHFIPHHPEHPAWRRNLLP